MTQREMMVALVANEARSAAELKSTLEERLVAAMKAAKHHWMVIDPDVQFAGACAAVHMLSDPETQKRIRDEVQGLGMLSAASSGIPVDFSLIPELQNPIGLIKYWRETT